MSLTPKMKRSPGAISLKRFFMNLSNSLSGMLSWSSTTDGIPPKIVILFLKTFFTSVIVTLVMGWGQTASAMSIPLSARRPRSPLFSPSQWVWRSFPFE